MTMETATKERPIPMRPESVRAIFSGTKTQTRRVLKPQPSNPETFGISPVWGSGVPRGQDRFCVHAAFNEGGRRVDRWLPCPYGKAGDRLWVRERHQILDGRPDVTDTPDSQPPTEDWPAFVTYEADDARARPMLPPSEWRSTFDTDEARSRPPRWMPRWASRITLEITGVQVERVQDISEADARAEGLTPLPDGPLPETPEPDGRKETYPGETAREQYASLWDRINGKAHPWASNPWVWVVEFKPDAAAPVSG